MILYYNEALGFACPVCFCLAAVARDRLARFCCFTISDGLMRLIMLDCRAAGMFPEW